MKISQLKNFLVTFDTGSIKEASNILCLSQSAVSKSIKELEIELGVELFSRSSKGITLTIFGSELYKRAKLILEEERRTKEHINTMNSGNLTKSKITIGVSAVTPGGGFTRAIERFMEKYQYVDIEIFEMRQPKLLESLREGEVDYILYTGFKNQQNSMFDWTELFKQETVLVVSKESSQKEARKVSELLKNTWLVQDSLSTSKVGALFDSLNIKERPRVIVCSSAVLYGEMASKGNFVSLWSTRILKKTNNMFETLCQLNIEDPLPQMDVSLVARDFELLPLHSKELALDIIREFKLEK